MEERMSARRILKVVSIGLLVLATGASATGSKKKGKMGGNGGMNGSTMSSGAYQQMYDPSTEETIKGSITKIDSITPATDMVQLVRITVKTDTGTVSVHLAPASYLQEQQVTLKPQRKVEVKGSRVMYDGKPTILASWIKANGKEAGLRDTGDGTPNWDTPNQ